MQSRTPSLKPEPWYANRLRRRSGGFPLRTTHHEIKDDICYEDTSRAKQEEFAPRLVDSRPSSPVFVPLPLSGERFPTVCVDPFDTLYADEEHRSSPEFTQVALTPRPDAPCRAQSDASFQSIQSFDSTQTRASQISRLPTPDFTDPRNRSESSGGFSTIRSSLNRGFSFVTFRPVPVSLFSFTDYDFFNHDRSSTQAPTLSSRSQSGETVCSTKSFASSASADSGHSTLIPSIGTTAKFTNKWPRPQSLRNLDGRRGAGGTCVGAKRLALDALEDGQGLGIDQVDTWNGFKWSLMLSVLCVFAYGVMGLVCATLTWFRAWEHADVMSVADYDVVVFVTLASSILVFCALVGMTGTLLNSRPILAVYAFVLWPALISILAIGYVTYKRAALSLDHKLDDSWSQYYTSSERLLIQDSLRCCGFYSPLHEATLSNRCYPRTPLPGCKGKLYRFEKHNLGMIWSAIFGIVVPLHMVNMTVALLCANHVTKTFGKGIMPRKYRLSSADVLADAEKILNGAMYVGARPLVRPELSRASSSIAFREDREQRMSISRGVR